MKHPFLRTILIGIFIISISSALADNLNVITVNDLNSPVPVEENEGVYGIYNTSIKNLLVVFDVGNPAVCINVYKNESNKLVISKLCSVNPNDTIAFPLSKHGSGNYKIVITMADEDDDFIGKFVVK